MAFDETLADRVRPLLAHAKGLTEKKMFGGIGFLLQGNLCVGVWKNFLILRLGIKRADEALEMPFVKKFDITGRAMKGWVMIDKAALADDDDLGDWIGQAVEFVRSLPRK